MNIGYAVGDERAPIVAAANYRAAADAAKDREESHVWIVGDDIEEMRLPLFFNRVLIVDGQTFRTCVANGIELTGNFPYSVKAPLLELDFDAPHAMWQDEDGDQRWLTVHRSS